MISLRMWFLVATSVLFLRASQCAWHGSMDRVWLLFAEADAEPEEHADNPWLQEVSP